MNKFEEALRIFNTRTRKHHWVMKKDKFRIWWECDGMYRCTTSMKIIRSGKSISDIFLGKHIGMKFWRVR